MVGRHIVPPLFFLMDRRKASYPHPQPFSQREKGAKSLSRRERVARSASSGFETSVSFRAAKASIPLPSSPTQGPRANNTDNHESRIRKPLIRSLGLCSGAISPRKQPPPILKAARQERKSHPALKCVIAHHRPPSRNPGHQQLPREEALLWICS